MAYRRRTGSRRSARRASPARSYRSGSYRPRRRAYASRSRRRSPATQTVRVVIQQGPSMPAVSGGAVSMTGLRKARF